MHGNVSRLVLGATVAALAVGAGGCGQRQFDVTGKVTYNGAPLDKPGGQIVFIGLNGAQVPAAIAPDGTYRASKVSAGLNKIAVYSPNPNAKSGKRFPVKRNPGGPPPPPAAPPEPAFLTPSKYATADTSDLTITVNQQPTVFDTDLTGPVIP